MVEIIDYHGRLSKRGPVLVIVAQIWHVFLFRVFTHFLIRRSPIIPALFVVYLVIEFVRLRVIFVDPLPDPRAVITAQVKVFQPHQAALAFGTLDDLYGISDAASFQLLQ